MSLSTGSGKLSFALKTLRAHWGVTQSHWTDEVRLDFEEQHLKLMETEVFAVLNAMNALGQVLAQAQQECR